MSPSANDTNAGSDTASTPQTGSPSPTPVGPMLPPPSGGGVSDIPPPRQRPTPLVDPELPRLADTAARTPPAASPGERPAITPPLTNQALPTLPTLPPTTPRVPTPPAHEPEETETGSTTTSVFEHPAPPADTSAATPAPNAAAGATDDEAEHPMAHLMMTKASATEASKRAAAIRAEKKAEARRTKIIVVTVLLVITASAGPFVGKWVIDNVNDAGNTSTGP